jgi:hypothetical protein
MKSLQKQILNYIQKCEIDLESSGYRAEHIDDSVEQTHYTPSQISRVKHALWLCKPVNSGFATDFFEFGKLQFILGVMFGACLITWKDVATIVRSIQSDAEKEQIRRRE